MTRTLALAVLLFASPGLAQSLEPAPAPAPLPQAAPAPPPPLEPLPTTAPPGGIIIVNESPPPPPAAEPPPDSTPPEQPPAAPPGPPTAKTNAMRLRLGGGIDYRRIYDIGMTTGDLTFSVGGERKNVAGFFNLTVFAGGTEYGLAVHDWRLGASGEWRLGRFRPGLGGDLGLLSVARATSPTAATALSVGFYGTASFDVATFGEGAALFVVAKLGVDMLLSGPWPFVYGPSAQMGFRF